MPIWKIDKSSDGWSEWRWRFALLPIPVGYDENGKRIVICWEWYQSRSRWSGCYIESRLPGVTEKNLLVDMTY